MAALADIVCVLVGYRFTSVTRTLDIAEITFEQVAGGEPGSAKRERHVLARCPFRVVREGVILLGSYDMYYRANGGDSLDVAFDSYRTAFDVNAKRLTGNLRQYDVRVHGVHLLPAGHVVIELSDDIRIDVVPVSSGPMEAWRLIEIGGEHHIYPPEDPGCETV